MSSVEDKVKKSKRIQKDENAVKKQAKIAKSHGMDVKEPHKFHKHHALDCGNPECGMCGNPRHIYKNSRTIQEKSFEQTKSWTEE